MKINERTITSFTNFLAVKNSDNELENFLIIVCSATSFFKMQNYPRCSVTSSFSNDSNVVNIYIK